MDLNRSRLTTPDSPVVRVKAAEINLTSLHSYWHHQYEEHEATKRTAGSIPLVDHHCLHQYFNKHLDYFPQRALPLVRYESCCLRALPPVRYESCYLLLMLLQHIAAQSMIMHEPSGRVYFHYFSRLI